HEGEPQERGCTLGCAGHRWPVRGLRDGRRPGARRKPPYPCLRAVGSMPYGIARTAIGVTVFGPSHAISADPRRRRGVRVYVCVLPLRVPFLPSSRAASARSAACDASVAPTIESISP